MLNMKLTKLIFTFLLGFLLLEVGAQPITGIWQGRLRMTNVPTLAPIKLELKLARMGDSLAGTAYYFQNTRSYARYSIKGFQDPRSGTLFWWNQDLLEVKGRLGAVRSDNERFAFGVDFSCPGGTDMFLEGYELREGERGNLLVELHKGTVPLYKDEWDDVIARWNDGEADPVEVAMLSSAQDKRNINGLVADNQPPSPPVTGPDLTRTNRENPASQTITRAPVPAQTGRTPTTVPNAGGETSVVANPEPKAVMQAANRADSLLADVANPENPPGIKGNRADSMLVASNNRGDKPASGVNSRPGSLVTVQTNRADSLAAGNNRGARSASTVNERSAIVVAAPAGRADSQIAVANNRADTLGIASNNRAALQTATTTLRDSASGQAAAEPPIAANTEPPNLHHLPIGQPASSRTGNPGVTAMKNVPAKPSVEAKSITNEEKFIVREKEIQTTIEIDNPEIVLQFYDNAEIDGDSISLFLNGKMIFENVRLTAMPFVVRFAVEELPEISELVMVAENLGEIPPNTAFMLAYVGMRRISARLESSEQKSAVIRLEKKIPTP